MQIIGLTKNESGMSTAHDFLPCSQQRRSRLWQESQPVALSMVLVAKHRVADPIHARATSAMRAL